MKKTVFLIALIILTSSVSTVLATLGPIHVELNMTKPRISAARANSLTSFNIYFRINKDIPIRNWVKVWFPIEEAVSFKDPEEFIKYICDGLPSIEGEKENARFVPSSDYFKKYNNVEEIKIGKLFSGSSHEGDVNFYGVPTPAELGFIKNWEECCNDKLPYPRLIKDPSGLGCWQMGTIFMGLPKNDIDRKERLKVLSRSVGINYYGDYDQGYPIVVNNCNERSYEMNVSFDINAWRKGYNPVFMNFGWATGIIAPATPGRYRVAVATEPEPEPVESEAFVLPCSDVSGVKIRDLGKDLMDEGFSVDFTTGEGGALDNGSSTIKIMLPKDVIVPKRTQPKTIFVNGRTVTTNPQIATFDGGSHLTLVCPTDIENLGKCTVTILKSSGIIPKANGNETFVEVSTSSEPNYIKSETFAFYSQPGTTIVPDTEKEQSAIFCRGVLPKGVKLTKDSQIRLVFPAGFGLPDNVLPENVSVNGKTVKICSVDKNNKLSITLPEDAEFYVNVKISQKSGITNPVAGRYRFAIEAGDQKLDCGEIEIVNMWAAITNLTMSEFLGGLATKISFNFKPTSYRALDIGDQMSIRFPEGMKIPEVFDDLGFTVNKVPVTKKKVNGQTIDFELPVPVPPFVKTLFEIDIGITNPRQSGKYSIRIYTSQGDDVESPLFAVGSPPLVSNIVFKKPQEPDGCSLWFTKQPEISFDCLDPLADIFYWLDDDKSKKVKFVSGFRLDEKTVETKICWQSKRRDSEEPAKNYYLKVDEEPPIFNLLQPAEEVIYTNKDTIIVSGDRVPSKIRFLGDDKTYRIVDDLAISNNNYTSMSLGEQMYKVSEESSIVFNFEKEIELNKGENIIQVVSKDEACNVTVKTRKVIKDSVPSVILVEEPRINQKILIGDEVRIAVKAENGSQVFVNGNVMKLESQSDGLSTFVFYIKAQDGENILNFEAIDKAGNKSSSKFTFLAKRKQTSIVLTLEKKEWTVNGVEQTPLKAAPTNRFTDPKLKALNGTTYMPITQVAPLLDCAVDWDAKEKKVTLTQALADGKTKTLELWLNNTIGKIDGREVTYNSKGTIFPTVIAGNTCLPFRWFAENLGAQVQFDAKSSQITLIYPK